MTKFSIAASSFLALFALQQQATSVASQGDDELCHATCEGDICTYTAEVNLFAGELGYFTFRECGQRTNPTLTMVTGKTYRFLQEDVSNYYHPLGFAYKPDGAHEGVDELEPGIVPPTLSDAGGASCEETLSCPAPMYVRQGAYLGTYSNVNPAVLPDVTNLPAEKTTGEDNFGLDDYEPLFFYPLLDWQAMGPFEIYVTIDPSTPITNDIYYFCHIHNKMSGRIKVMSEDGSKLVASSAAEEPLGYEYDKISAFDGQCGTFNTSAFQLPHEQCPSHFVCEVNHERVTDTEAPMGHFAECLDAMNCAMMVGMTSHAHYDEIALFIHQMIPHHQNAVNMAKALLKTGVVDCPQDNLDDEESEACVLNGMMREIINGQNAQIQTMQGILEGRDQPAFDDCKVDITSTLAN